MEEGTHTGFVAALDGGFAAAFDCGFAALTGSATGGFDAGASLAGGALSSASQSKLCEGWLAVARTCCEEDLLFWRGQLDKQ